MYKDLCIYIYTHPLIDISFGEFQLEPHGSGRMCGHLRNHTFLKTWLQTSHDQALEMGRMSKQSLGKN